MAHPHKGGGIGKFRRHTSPTLGPSPRRRAQRQSISRPKSAPAHPRSHGAQLDPASGLRRSDAIPSNLRQTSLSGEALFDRSRLWIEVSRVFLSERSVVSVQGRKDQMTLQPRSDLCGMETLSCALPTLARQRCCWTPRKSALMKLHCSAVWPVKTRLWSRFFISATLRS